MIELRKILAPTDFSSHSENALRYASAFADQFGAELHVLNVLQDPVTMMPEPGLPPGPWGDYTAELEEAARKRLDELPGALRFEKSRLIHEVRKGAPFLEIIWYAKKNAIDLIVIGTHGRTGLAHMLMGSVAEKVVRNAPCPVRTVRHPDHKFVMP